MCYINHKVQKKDMNRIGTLTAQEGRPKTMWKRIIEQELQKVGKNWRETKGLALDRTKWKSFMKVPFST
jgi:ribosomal protein L32E